jgi:hypothetical protein
MKGCGASNGSAGSLGRNIRVVKLGGRGFSSAVRRGNDGTSGAKGTTLERSGFSIDDWQVLAKSRERNATRPMARKLTAIAK